MLCVYFLFPVRSSSLMLWFVTDGKINEVLALLLESAWLWTGWRGIKKERGGNHVWSLERGQISLAHQDVNWLKDGKVVFVAEPFGTVHSSHVFTPYTSPSEFNGIYLCFSSGSCILARAAGVGGRWAPRGSRLSSLWGQCQVGGVNLWHVLAGNDQKPLQVISVEVGGQDVIL